jgi:FAD/FMN-containing dehydrogenase
VPNLTLTTADGGTTTVSQEAIDALRNDLKGDLLLPGGAGYDEARTIWNAMIDRRPGIIVACQGAPDVATAIRFAAKHGIRLAVRSGGHNIAGSAVCDGGMMISLAGMKSVRVDRDARRAWVEPGNTLGDVDRETQAHGLAVPTGINSTTGIAGLTLGGGFGWLSRKHGLTIDSLVSAQVVTASGETVRTSDKQHPELFWAIRGGGGNFGIVTEFEFALHPVGPEVLAGLIVHPFKDAKRVLHFYREFCASAPDELSVWVVMRKAPPLPFLPESVHGTEVLVLAALYAGDPAAGEAALAPLRAFGTPIADVIGPSPFTGFQAAFDPLLTPGARNYWKSHNFLDLSDGLIDTLLPAVGVLPDPQCEIFIAQMGGATNRVAADATAYPHRDVEFIMNVHGRWSDAADDARCTAWCRQLFDTAAPFATGGAYVNFMTDDEAARVQTVYGENYQRLTALKRQLDPTNLFRLNQNIQSGGAA